MYWITPVLLPTTTTACCAVQRQGEIGGDRPSLRHRLRPLMRFPAVLEKTVFLSKVEKAPFTDTLLCMPQKERAVLLDQKRDLFAPVRAQRVILFVKVRQAPLPWNTQAGVIRRRWVRIVRVSESPRSIASKRTVGGAASSPHMSPRSLHPGWNC